MQESANKNIWDVEQSGNQIVIKVDSKLMARAVEQNPDQDLKVVDDDAFAAHCVAALTDHLDDQGRLILGGVFDDIALKAFEESEEFVVDPNEED